MTKTADTNDGLCDADCSLREAITTANTVAGQNIVNFNISGSGTKTIVLGSALPTISDSVIIDATTQPGYVAIPLIEIDGNAAGGTANGFLVTAGNTTIKGVAIIRFKQTGIRLTTNGSNTIQGNFIGADANTAAKGNEGGGILIDNTANNQIGGTETNQANVIAYNTGIGVSILGSSGNRLAQNLIYGNTGLGIDLAGNGVTPNDTGDADTGANGLQNFPVLTSATRTATSINISGTYNSKSNSTIRFEFFSSPTCDASGYSEGKTFLGAMGLFMFNTTNATISAGLLANVPAGYVITATATDSNNNTSEFSACITVVDAPTGSTLTVTKTADTADGVCNADCSLREAISAANAAPGSTINLPDGTYTLTRTGTGENANATGDLDINANITINGTNQATTIIDAAQIDRVFDIASNRTVSLSNLTIRNGTATSGGGINMPYGLLQLNYVTVTQNSATTNVGTGGGINGYQAAFHLTNSIVSSNTAVNSGGGIASNGSISLDNVIISGNSQTDNSGGGGGIYLYSRGAGGITVNNSLFTNNTARAGGAISAYLENYSSALVMNGSTLSNNTGGALAVQGATITSSTFTNNTRSSGRGGAIGNASGTLNIESSTFGGNSSTTGGGAISTVNGSLTLVNSTFSSNSAPTGGAIEVGINTPSTPVTARLTHVTIADSVSGGGIYLWAGETALLYASILNNNTGGNCAVNGSGALFTSENYNLASDSTCNPYFTASGDANGVNPLLDTLANNGGTTQTIALLTGSPAIDRVPSANCRLSIDQRGITRPVQSGCDSGAYEFVSNGTPTPEASESPTAEVTPEVTETPTPEATESLTPEATESPTPEITESPTPEVTETPTAPTPETTAPSTPEITESPTPEATDTPTAPTPEATESLTPEVTETPTAPTPEATESPTPEATESPTPEITESPTPEVSETPTAEITPEVSETPTPETTETATPEITPEVSETPTAEVTPEVSETPTPDIPASTPDAAPIQNYYTTATPTLTWGSVSWATGYDIEVSRNNGFTDKVFVGSTANLSITTTALGDGTYFWRVRAKAPGRTGGWSAIDSFVVDMP